MLIRLAKIIATLKYFESYPTVTNIPIKITKYTKYIILLNFLSLNIIGL